MRKILAAEIRFSTNSVVLIDQVSKTTTPSAQVKPRAINHNTAMYEEKLRKLSVLLFSKKKIIWI